MSWTLVGNISGPPGPPGNRGPGWHFGNGPPGSIPSAISGDMYIDLDTGDIYSYA